MKLIIDIPEECLKNISNAFEFGEDITKRTIDIILDSITKSTPIPDNVPTVDVLEKIRTEIYQLHYHPKLDFIKTDEVVDMALDIIDNYREEQTDLLIRSDGKE